MTEIKERSLTVLLKLLDAWFYLACSHLLLD